MARLRAIMGLTLLCCLAGCAEPRALMAPVPSPSMDRPAVANPLPAYAQPRPDPQSDRTPAAPAPGVGAP